ncbi:MAG: hypothetical protein O7D91_17515 [Planctomycetota bacterium]|nr:hypothetical protein [Planctomycetota bacterium]
MAFFGIRNKVRGQPPQSFESSVVSTEMLPPNTNRKALFIKNASMAKVYLAFNGHDAVVGKGVSIEKGEILQVGATLLPIESINVISDVGMAGTIEFQEWL